MSQVSANRKVVATGTVYLLADSALKKYWTTSVNAGLEHPNWARNLLPQILLGQTEAISTG
jgi:hypothetical protein